MQTSELPQFLIDNGILQEINRLILHPLGMALAVVQDGALWRYDVRDHRHEPNGLVFENDDPLAWQKCHRFRDLHGRAVARRMLEIGFGIQPMETMAPPMGDQATPIDVTD